MQSVTCKPQGLIYAVLLASGFEVVYSDAAECTLQPRRRYPDCFHCGGIDTVQEYSLSEGWGISCTRCGVREAHRAHSAAAARTAWDMREVTYVHVRCYSEISD